MLISILKIKCKNKKITTFNCHASINEIYEQNKKKLFLPRIEYEISRIPKSNVIILIYTF